MRVQCDRCGSSYTLPEARVAAGRRLQFQCRHCQHRIIVQVPVPGEAQEQAVAPAAKVLWFISTASGPQQRMDTEGVHSAIGEGSVVADSWLWRKGMAEWARAAELPEFASSFAVPSPTAAMEPLVVAGAHQAVVDMARPAVLSGSHVAGAASVHKGAGFQTDQRAIPMPIVRATASGAEAISEDAKPRPQVLRQVLRPSIRDTDAARQGTGLQQAAGHPAASRPTPVTEGKRDSSLDLRAEVRNQEKATAEGRTSAYAAMPDDDGPQNGNEKANRGKWSPATDTYTGQRARMTRRVDDQDRNDAVQWAKDMDRREAEMAQLQGNLKAWQRLVMATLAALAVLALLTCFLAYRWRDAANARDACAAAHKTAPK